MSKSLHVFFVSFFRKSRLRLMVTLRLKSRKKVLAEQRIYFKLYLNNSRRALFGFWTHSLSAKFLIPCQTCWQAFRISVVKSFYFVVTDSEKETKMNGKMVPLSKHGKHTALLLSTTQNNNNNSTSCKLVWHQ